MTITTEHNYTLLLDRGDIQLPLLNSHSKDYILTMKQRLEERDLKEGWTTKYLVSETTTVHTTKMLQL